MKSLITTTLLLASIAAPALAQPKAEEHSAHHPASAAAAAANMAEGEVRKVDKAAKKLTIKHGEIKNLDMPPMTMVFQVKDAALLEAVKAGDKIRFVAEKTPAGYAVTVIEAAN
jgi:Cu(I)/Ag(I) efflux system protein CusF